MHTCEKSSAHSTVRVSDVDLPVEPGSHVHYFLSVCVLLHVRGKFTRAIVNIFFRFQNTRGGIHRIHDSASLAMELLIRTREMIWVLCCDGFSLAGPFG